jgi:hypothetical protein
LAGVELLKDIKDPRKSTFKTEKAVFYSNFSIKQIWLSIDYFITPGQL